MHQHENKNIVPTHLKKFTKIWSHPVLYTTLTLTMHVILLLSGNTYVFHSLCRSVFILFVFSSSRKDISYISDLHDGLSFAKISLDWNTGKHVPILFYFDSFYLEYLPVRSFWHNKIILSEILQFSVYRPGNLIQINVGCA